MVQFRIGGFHGTWFVIVCYVIQISLRLKIAFILACYRHWRQLFFLKHKLCSEFRVRIRYFFAF